MPGKLVFGFDMKLSIIRIMNWKKIQDDKQELMDKNNVC